jgi:hypothetical protein
VRKLATSSGPFPFQLYFEDLGEIDEICLEALERQSLLPSKPAPIRIERFVEKEFKTSLIYEDLGPGNLGYTIFNSSGAVEAILISRFLEEQNTTPARRRARSTVAHEAGHGLLHGPLFIGSADLGEKQRLILCRSQDILVETPRPYQGRWWEFQANQAIGSLLLPRLLVVVDPDGNRREEWFEPVNQYTNMVDAFSEAVLNKRRVPLQPEDGLNNIKVLEAIARSSTKNTAEYV